MHFIIPVSIYIGLYSLVFIQQIAAFSVCFCIAFRSFGFSCRFFSSSFLLQVHYFSRFVTCFISTFEEGCLASNGL